MVRKVAWFPFPSALLKRAYQRGTGATLSATELRFTDISQIDEEALLLSLEQSHEVQWDYKNIFKLKGNLVRLR